MTTWNKLAKEVFSTEDNKRITEISKKVELPNNDNITREVLMTAWELTRLSDGKNAYGHEEWVLNASLELLVDLYKDINFQEVMNKLQYD